MEFVIIFFTVLGGTLAFITYYKKFVEEPNSVKNFSISKIESAKKTNNDFLNDIYEYAETNNALNQHFMQGFTFGEVIKVLEIHRDEIFSDEHMKAIKKIKDNSISLEDVTKNVENHIIYLNQCNTYFRKNILNEELNSNKHA